MLPSRYFVAELPALSMRVADARGALQSVPVRRDDFPFANVENHRVEPLIASAPTLVVDHHAHRPAVLAVAQDRVLLVEGLGACRELDQGKIGLDEPGSQMVADDFFVVLRARAVIERRELFAG